MTRLRTTMLMSAIAAVALTGCQVKKSANPLSPSVAGPIEGVVIGTPYLLEPGQDWQMKTRDQPIRLMFRNTETSGQRPLKYSFEIASDSQFKTIVFSRTGLDPASGEVTEFQLPDRLAAGTYWWRTRAADGANTGPYSPVQSFEVLADVILAPPAPQSPSNGSTVSDLTPEFKVKAGNRSGVTADLEYILQVSNNSSFTSIAAIFTKKETWPETTFDQNYAFLHNRTYYWRVRVWHTADGSDLSNWSQTFSFRTPAPPAAPPPPPPGGGGGGGGGGDTSKCNSSEGRDIADCIMGRYPSYLAAGVSLDRRKQNMAFLRDRMIEHGKCRGLDLGLNLKRGGPEISYDFLVHRRPGRPDQGVDIGSAYDDTSRQLRLAWHTYDASENWGYPYYKNYGSVSC